jgi:hypothetical protein
MTIRLMADLQKDQKLDPHEFIIAMFLIANRKRGFELPAVVPESLIASAWPDPSSPTQPSLPPGNQSPAIPALTTPAVHSTPYLLYKSLTSHYRAVNGLSPLLKK